MRNSSFSDKFVGHILNKAVQMNANLQLKQLGMVSCSSGHLST